MGEINLVGCPRAGAPLGTCRSERSTKDGQLVAESPPSGRLEVAGPVPPLAAKSGVRTVVFGELELAGGDGASEVRVARRRAQRLQHREPRLLTGRIAPPHEHQCQRTDDAQGEYPNADERGSRRRLRAHGSRSASAGLARDIFHAG